MRACNQHRVSANATNATLQTLRTLRTLQTSRDIIVLASGACALCVMLYVCNRGGRANTDVMSCREISRQRLYLRQGVYSDFASSFLPEFTPGSIQYITGGYILYTMCRRWIATSRGQVIMSTLLMKME